MTGAGRNGDDYWIQCRKDTTETAVDMETDDDSCCCCETDDSETGESEEVSEDDGEYNEEEEEEGNDQAMETVGAGRRRSPASLSWSFIKKYYQIFQRAVKALVEHKYFQQGLLGAILINTLSMGIEYHNQVSYQPA